MIYRKYFDLSLSGILIPLWIVLFFELIKNKTLLTLIITGIISLIILAIFVRAGYKVLDITQKFFKCRLRRIDAFARKTRKKMKKLISGTNSPIIMDYAIEKMRESCKSEVCVAIIGELAEKERDPGKKGILLSYKERIGGFK